MRMTIRQRIPNRRESLTQKIRVGNRRTLYLSTHDASADAHTIKLDALRLLDTMLKETTRATGTLPTLKGQNR